jgi:Tol biopolymer transport system component
METDNIISPDVAVLANNSGSTIFQEIRTSVDEIVQTNICVPVAQQSSISPQDSEVDLSESLIAPDQSRLIRNYEDNSGTGIYHDNQFNFELQTWIHDGSTVHISTVELCEGSKIITSTGYLLQLSPKIPLNITCSGSTFEIA